MVHIPTRAGRLADGGDVRRRVGDRDGPIPFRRTRSAPVGGHEPDGAPDRARPAGGELERQGRHLRLGDPALVRGLPPRRVPRLLPGRGRHAARPHVTARRGDGVDGQLRRVMVGNAREAAIPGRVPTHGSRPQARSDPLGDRGDRLGDLDRHQRRDRACRAQLRPGRDRRSDQGVRRRVRCRADGSGDVRCRRGLRRDRDAQPPS